MKTCFKCLESKILDDFYKSKKAKDGLNGACKKCMLAEQKIYYESNKVACNKASAEWAKNNRGKVREIHRNWVANNKKANTGHKQDWLEKNPEKRKVASKKYADNNRELYNAKEANRRARKLNATPIWADLEAIKDVYKEAEYFQMEVDHIVPLQNSLVCGLHVWDNLQLLTSLDNKKKGRRFNIRMIKRAG